MDSLQLDALGLNPSGIIAQPWLINSKAWISGGIISQIIAPATGQPASRFLLGFSQEIYQQGFSFGEECMQKPALIALTYSYEQGTKQSESAKIIKA